MSDAAVRITQLLADPNWRPTRVHLEQARNAILVLTADLATADLRANGGCLDVQQAAKFMRPLLLDSALFKSSWERMVCLAALHEVSEIGAEERIPWHADNPYAGLYDAADEVASSVYDQAWLEHGQ